MKRVVMTCDKRFELKKMAHLEQLGKLEVVEGLDVVLLRCWVG